MFRSKGTIGSQTKPSSLISHYETPLTNNPLQPHGPYSTRTVSSEIGQAMGSIRSGHSTSSTKKHSLRRHPNRLPLRPWIPFLHRCRPNTKFPNRSNMHPTHTCPHQRCDSMHDSSRRNSLIALILVGIAPSVSIFASFGSGNGLVGQLAWLTSKAWMLGLPLVWMLYVDKKPFSWSLHGKVVLASDLEWV